MESEDSIYELDELDNITDIDEDILEQINNEDIDIEEANYD